MKRHILWLSCLVLLSGPFAQAADLETSELNHDAGSSDAAQRRHAMREHENAGLVGVISGGIDGTDLRVATDLASVLDGTENGLRIFAVAGKGSLQNVNDVVFTRGIDIGIVQSDVLAYLEREPPFPGLQQYVRYITKLYDEEIHVLAARDIRSIQDLAGKKVNIDGPGSGTYMTARMIFDGLHVPVETTTFDQPLALEKLKQGEIAALVYVVGKPARLFEGLGSDDHLHFLPIAATSDLPKTYTPATLTPHDYPGLVDTDSRVDTLSVGSVMVVYNWPPGSERYRRVERFVDAFFNRLQDLREPPRHPKWRRIDLAAPVEGWTRFGPAEKRVRTAQRDHPVTQAKKAGAEQRGERQALQSQQLDPLFREFAAYLKGHREPASAAAPLDQGREALFKEFVEWRRHQAEPPRFAGALGTEPQQ